MTELSINHVDVAKLDVQPGEVLLVTVDRPITMEMAARIRDAFKEEFERSGKVMPGLLINDPSMKVSVVKHCSNAN